jgi:DNA-binding IclR family transcriptional regulator
MTLNEICGRVGIHKSKAFSILNTLQEFGIILKNSEGKGYSLGPGLVDLSRGFLEKLSVPRLAEPVVDELSRKTGNTVVFGMIANKHAFIVARHDGDQPIAITVRLGQRFPLTYGSHGKAIAAMLSEDELEEVLKEEKVYFHGKPASFDEERLRKEIEQYRRDGFTTEIGEMAPGIGTVAAGVAGPNRSPMGYIVMLGFFSAEVAAGLGPLVAEGGRGLSEQLGAGTKRKAGVASNGARRDTAF